MAAAANVFRRETGSLSTRTFTSRVVYSQDHVRRLDSCRKIKEHEGNVSSVCFNASGDKLITGSSDRMIILWDWESGAVRSSMLSGHRRSINQAQFMPFSGDRSIVTCGADGMVRHVRIRESGDVNSVLLTQHGGQAHSLAIEAGSAHTFYTCGDDGMVQYVDVRTPAAAARQLFVCPTVSFKYVNGLTGIATDPRNPCVFAIGGRDALARVYDVRKYSGLAFVDSFSPPHLSPYSSISGLTFSSDSDLLVSYIAEPMYLFSKDMGMGPDPTLTYAALSYDSVAEGGPTAFKGHINMLRINNVRFIGPKCEYVASTSDCGRIYIWKKKNGELFTVLDANALFVNCVEPHPHVPALACGTDEELQIWAPKATDIDELPDEP